MKIHFETIGCRLNQVETQSLIALFYKCATNSELRNLLQKFNIELSDLFKSSENCVNSVNCLNQVNSNNNIAILVTNDGVTSNSPVDNFTDICILNTCAVTQKAETKCRHVINLLLSHYPCAKIIVTGCYAQINKDTIEKIDSRIKVLSMDEKRALIALSNGGGLLAPCDKTSKSRAALKIQDGCNNNCSYCVIHIARGKSKSVDAATVIKNCQILEESLYHEVVFTGVNLAQYKSDVLFFNKLGGVQHFDGEYLSVVKNQNYSNKIGLSELLQLCLENTKSIHFRLSSIYGEVVDDDFCKVISNSRVAPYFHISVQSGSDKILSLMGRSYTRHAVIECVKKLRSVKSNPFISCDIITGFPGETQDDFIETFKLCKECNFAFIHVFPYSARPGTMAAKMPQIPKEISKARAKKLEEFARNQKIQYISNCIGKEYFAILEIKEVSDGEKDFSIKNLSKNNVFNDTLQKEEYTNITCVTENYLHCKIINACDFSIANGNAAIVKVTSIKDVKLEGASKVSDIDCFAKVVKLL